MQRTQHINLNLAIHPWEAPHPRQCLAILPPGHPFPSSGKYRRCQACRLSFSRFCVAHQDVPTVRGAFFPVDPLEAPDRTDATCCPEYEESGHHEPDCRAFFA